MSWSSRPCTLVLSLGLLPFGSLSLVPLSPVLLSPVLLSPDSLFLVLSSPCYHPVVLSFHSICSPVPTRREFPCPWFPSYRHRRLI